MTTHSQKQKTVKWVDRLLLILVIIMVLGVLVSNV